MFRNSSLRSAFVDAVIVATLAGVLLSSLVGCAGATARTVSESIRLHRGTPAEDFSGPNLATRPESR